VRSEGVMMLRGGALGEEEEDEEEGLLSEVDEFSFTSDDEQDRRSNLKLSRSGLVTIELVESGEGYAVGLEEGSEVLINVSAR